MMKLAIAQTSVLLFLASLTNGQTSSVDIDPTQSFNPNNDDDDIDANEQNNSDPDSIVDDFRQTDISGERTVRKTKTAIIPKGATENNEEGFYLDGDYSTVRNEYGEMYLEVNLKLHHDGIRQLDDGIYMIWLQVIDPIKTLQLEKEYYEGFACAVRYDKELGSRIRSNFLYRFGYRGTERLTYATGTFDRLLRDDQTENYSWLLQPKNSYLTIDERNQVYTENCNMYRDFETTYSDVPIRTSGVLTFNAGFKIYNYLEDISPTWVGHKNNVQWDIIDIEEGASAFARIGLIAVVLGAIY